MDLGALATICTRRKLRTLLMAATLFASASPAPILAGGAWVPERGRGDIQLGFSRKTATSSWAINGTPRDNTTNHDGQTVSHHHDFRYVYFSGEVGLSDRVSGTWLMTYLHGLEGPEVDLEKNRGFSDAWFGVKVALQRGELPVALLMQARTAYFYDIDGSYERHLYDDDGEFVGLSPEWRGLLRQDLTLGVSVSRSFSDARGWASATTGYTWRQGAPANEIPFQGEGAWRIPGVGAYGKLALSFVQSQGNDSPRATWDRFGGTSTVNNFNDASMARLGLSAIVPLGGDQPWLWIEAGYTDWIWGRSSRQYKEPFVSVSRPI